MRDDDKFFAAGPAVPPYPRRAIRAKEAAARLLRHAGFEAFGEGGAVEIFADEHEGSLPVTDALF